MHELAIIEQELGDPSDFVLTSEKVNALKTWLQLKGYHAAEVHGMTMTQMVNKYVTSETKLTNSETIKKSSEIFMAMANAFANTKIDENLIREIAKQELEKQPPKHIIIETPSGTTQISGIVHYMTETILKIVSLSHPVMMVGPAGCGKTSIAETISKALNMPFYVTSTITDTHELMGYVDGYGKYHTTPFRQAYENGGVWIADEVDAWDANPLLAANSALANGFASFPDLEKPLLRHEDFRMIATANTFGSGADRLYVGRNELDAASLDRFAMVEVDYDLSLERMFSNGNEEWLQTVWKTRKAVEKRKIRHVVSSRSIIMGSKALSAGLEMKQVLDIYLLKGMSKSDRDKIERIFES